MSTDETEADMMCCALCGKSELDDIKLMDCDSCDLVRYCSDQCKEDHLPQHEAMCKERAAELRDEILFRQPESSHRGDCPICFLPHPIYQKKPPLYACCSTTICEGCSFANQKREWEEKLKPACPFCRNILPNTDEEANKNTMKRAAANDPVALSSMGTRRYEEGDYVGAFEYCTKAAELGDAMAHFDLSHFYQEGLGVEKDEKMRLYHLEKAAIAGHPAARYNLACHEWRNKRFDRAVKHLIISANLGHDKAIQTLKECYKRGLVSKEEFAAALRANQAAINESKSPQRDAAEAFENFRASQQQTFEN